MKSTNELKQRTTNEYFGKVFSELYKEWKSKTPDGNQQKFAELCDLGSKNSVSNYVRGKSIPTDASVDEIIRVFNEAGMNVTIEDFIPHTDADTYRYSPSRVKTHQKSQWEKAKAIGLSEGFLDFIFNHTSFSDPNEGYPVWSPLEGICRFGQGSFKTNIAELKYIEDSFVVTEIKRSPLQKTNAVSDDQSFAVNVADGSSQMLSPIDLYILKDLQDEITDVVQYFYFKRKKIMKAQEIEATIQANPIQEDGISYGCNLSIRDRIKIDPYMKYLKFVDEKGNELTEKEIDERKL